MPTVDGKLVSESWGVVLAAARGRGIAFRLNSGRRTMEEQRRLRAAYERRLQGGPWAPLAAVPSCSAPHIDCNQESHAIDVESNDGGAGRVARWLRGHGARADFTVPKEPWHIEVPEHDLKRLSRELSDPLRFLNPTERRWVEEYDRLKRASRDRPRRASLRRAMKAQRKRIWRAAQKGGWDKWHRRERYRALHARTE